MRLSIEKRINAFVNLGKDLNYIAEKNDSAYLDNIPFVKQRAEAENPWFIKSFIDSALKSIAFMLEEQKLNEWISSYDTEFVDSKKTVALITAGNIPLVGFHDLFCSLISGFNVVVKPSSKDAGLTSFLLDLLTKIEPDFKSKITVTSGRITNFDYIIATGSDNSSRYFEYYFEKYPHIIRKNRKSAAIISENDNFDTLKLLSDDIFLYFGLGCRNVSKLFIPEGYEVENLFEAFKAYDFIGNNNKYANNYDYYKALFLMNNIRFKDNGFALFTYDDSLSGNISVINYEFYKDIEVIKNNMIASENIQCLVSSDHSRNTILPGLTQYPGLTDYADNIDTMKFLINK